VPALPAVHNVVRVNMPYAIAGAPNALNRFYMSYAGTPPNTAELTTFCNAVTAGWSAGPKQKTSSGVSMGPTFCEDLGSTSGAIATGSTAVAGVDGHAMATAAAATVVNFHLARRYRGGKPKMFTTMGTAFDMADANTWGGAFLTAALIDWNIFINAVIAATWAGAVSLTHVNVSYYSGFSVVTNPITGRARNVPTLRATPLVDPIVGYSVNPTIGSQRRRLGM
jgi:hypothetical protein